MNSERLKELQDMEKYLSATEEGEIQPAHREINLGAGTYRVADGLDTEEDKRRKLSRRQAAAEDRAHSGLKTWRVSFVIGVTIVSCLVLLWALFSGETPDKFIKSPPSSKPIKASELQRLKEEGGRENHCPDPWWLPEDCLDKRRTKSKTTLDKCAQIFADYEYSIQLLEECGIIAPGD